MNLFVTDSDPVKCAHALDDKRVGKLLMECNQMLGLAVKEHWPIKQMSQLSAHEGVGKLIKGRAYVNHPVSIWVRASRRNFEWTVAHARELASEFKMRYGGDHASAARTEYAFQFKNLIPAGEMTPFQNSARHEGKGLDFSHLPIHEAYRTYLSTRWKTDILPVNFTGREEPEWRSMT